ncbi:MAG: ribonuclease HI [Chloroflexota bacterium]|nr:ribonuclease HI [Dehalococcoidia bacterium]MDW8252302.1 ribonuclease HI [Chloroflexota bacterium]
MPHVVLYTDGACLGNPGPGGYGVVLLYGDKRKELSGGRRRTTNNRMELLAAIVGLAALKRSCRVDLYTDSQYLYNGIVRGWAARWQRAGWRKADKTPVKNVDLWEQLLAELARHEVTFHWVRGHAGTAENERADRLSLAAAKRPDLPPDVGFEAAG